MIDAVAERYGQTVLRTNVGEGHVIDRGLTEGAVLAGEGSGGVAALPATTTFDSLLTLGLVLEGMARNQTTLPDMVADLPHYEIRKGELSLPPDLVYTVVDGLRTHYAHRSPDSTDGVRV